MKDLVQEGVKQIGALNNAQKMEGDREKEHESPSEWKHIGKILKEK